MEGKRKHLTLTDRIQIERGLDSNKNFTEIGKEIGKDPTTVSKEVRKHIHATVFTPEEIKKFKAEAFSKFSNGKPKYQQPAAYILMLNTGLRTGELLDLLNSDINLEGRYLEVHQNVKEVCRREGTEYIPGREVKVGKTKTATREAQEFSFAELSCP